MSNVISDAVGDPHVTARASGQNCSVMQITLFRATSPAHVTTGVAAGSREQIQTPYPGSSWQQPLPA